MGWKKRHIVEEAYAELALAGYVYDLAPEEMQAALRKLDLLMAQWVPLGINVGYAQGIGPESSGLDDESGLPLVAVNAVVLGLAVALAASKGKSLGASTLRSAKEAKDALLSHIAHLEMREQQLNPIVPAGAGSIRLGNSGRHFLDTPTTSSIGDGSTSLGD